MERVDLGLTARTIRMGEGWALALRSRRLARFVHIEDDAFRAEDEWFHLAPGVERVVRLIPRGVSATLSRGHASAVPDGEVHALNAVVPVRFREDA